MADQSLEEFQKFQKLVIDRLDVVLATADRARVRYIEMLTKVGPEIDRLRVEFMARLDRQQDDLTKQRADIGADSEASRPGVLS